MMTDKANELEGAELDLAVAKALGWSFNHESLPNWFYTEEPDGMLHMREHKDNWHPSSEWFDGGLLIEEYGIGIWKDFEGNWRACFNEDGVFQTDAKGPTPLIAACRALVASKECDKGDL